LPKAFDEAVRRASETSDDSSDDDVEQEIDDFLDNIAPPPSRKRARDDDEYFTHSSDQVLPKRPRVDSTFSFPTQAPIVSQLAQLPAMPVTAPAQIDPFDLFSPFTSLTPFDLTPANIIPPSVTDYFSQSFPAFPQSFDDLDTILYGK
jgi:hypothetical protein